MKLLQFAYLFFLLSVGGIAFAGEQVDINAADAAAIAKVLAGIGPDKAAAIVAYRTDHGPFKNMNDLVKVKGIGEKLLNANRDRITLGAVAAKTASK